MPDDHDRTRSIPPRDGPQPTGDWTPAEPDLTTDASPGPAPTLSVSQRLASRASDPPPEIPGFEVLGVLGRGGMGVVYKAREIRLNRLCALKMILGHADPGDEAVSRFLAEAEAVAKLRHPGIVPIHGLGEHDGRPFCVFEFIPGGSLAARLDGSPRPPEWAARTVRVLAQAVAAAHREGIVHRDLKPANVLMDADDSPRVTDFGLAKTVGTDSGLTRSGSILGTPSYMAPEQAEGQTHDVGPPADIYALGAILYELITGRPPFRGATVLQTLELVRSADPVPPSRLVPSTPRDLETICLKCLEKDRSRRYPSAEALASDLGLYLDGHPISARPVGPFERARRWCARNPLLASLWTGVAASLVLGTVFSTSFALRARRGEREAVQARRLSERRLYVTQMNLARNDWLDGKMNNARRRLDELVPRLANDPDDRHFEWYYMDRLCHLDRVRLEGHDGMVVAGDLSPDGQHAVTVDEQDHIRLWALPDARLIARLPDSDALDVQFSPDGAWLAVPVWEQGIALFSVPSGRLERVLPGIRGRVFDLEFHPNGRQLAVVTNDTEAVVWDLETGQIARTLPIDGGRHGSRMSVTFSPDGGRLATGAGSGLVEVWDAASGLRLHVLDADQGAIVRTLSFSPDGTRLAAGFDNEEAVLFELGGNESIHELPDGVAGSRVLFLTDDRLAVADRRGTIRVWNPIDEAVELTLRGHGGSVERLSRSANGLALLSASRDGTARLWEARLDTSQLAFDVPVAALGITPIGVSTDGRDLAAISPEFAINLFEPSTGRLVRSLNPVGVEWDSLVISPDGRTLSAFDQDHAGFWDLAREAPEATVLDRDGRINTSVAISPDGRFVAVGDREPAIELYDVPNRRMVRRVFLDPDAAAVHALAFGPDSRRLAVGTEDGQVNEWDIVAGIRRGELGRHEERVLSVAYSSDGRYVASGGFDHVIHLWDVDTRKGAGTMVGQEGFVDDLAFSADGRRLVSAGSEGSVKVWDLSTLSDVLTIEDDDGPPIGLALSPDSSRLVVWKTRGRVVARSIEALTDSDLARRAAAVAVATAFDAPMTRRLALAQLEHDPFLEPGERAVALEMARDYPEPAAHLDGAAWVIVLDPDSSPADVALAVEFAETARRLRPGDGSAITSLGAALIRAGRPDQAIPLLQRSLSLNADSDGIPTVFDLAFLCLAQSRAGDLAGARDTLQRLDTHLPTYSKGYRERYDGLVAEARDSVLPSLPSPLFAP